MKVIDITIADDHIPRKRQAKRKANITVFDDSENQMIGFYYEDGTDHGHLYNPKDPKEVKRAAEVLAEFFREPLDNALAILKLFTPVADSLQRPENQCPQCDSLCMSVHKYNDGRCKRTEVYCEECGYENEY